MTTGAVNPPPTNLITPGASLTGRHEYLNWINGSLKMEMKQVEEMCTGAVYCQFMDILFPGSVSLKLVKWDATAEHQYIDNFKILQNCFSKHNVKKKIPIDKLSKGKFMDNYDFLMWFKFFYDSNFTEWPQNYDPEEVRDKSRLARPPSANRRTPDCSSSPGANRLTPSRDARASSPSSYSTTKTMDAQNTSAQRVHELTLEKRALEQEMASVQAQLMDTEHEREQQKYVILAVQDYCRSTNTKEDHLAALLAITQEMPKMFNQPQQNHDAEKTY